MLGLVRSFRLALIGLCAAMLIVVGIAPVGATGIVQGDLVGEVPAANTPQFLDNEVRANIQVGNRIVVGGDFTQVRDDTFGLVDQANLASYDLSTGRLDINFLPDLDGGVNSIVDAGDGTIIVVGIFNTVNGQTRRSVAKLNVVDGSLVTAFTANADAEVQDVVIADDRVYIGGAFNLVNTVPRTHLAAVDLATGDVAADFDFPLSEPTGYYGAGGVRALDVTPDLSTLVVGHNSHRVAGEVRQSLALIDIAGTPFLQSWRTDNYDYHCQPQFTSFERPLMRDLQVSPDGTYFVVATSIGNFAPGCDVAVKFPVAGGADTDPLWVARLFDTPEAVAITDQAIYVGGHFRWLMGTGAVWTDYSDGNTNTQPDNTVVRDQIGALDIDTGTALDWDPGATGVRGVLALRVTDAGLLVGTDGEWVGGRQVYRHALLELPEVPSTDTTDPSTTISSPLDGQLVDNTVALGGTAVDDVGVADVLVTIQDRDTLQFMQLDGSFNDDGWQLHRAFVPDAYSAASDWLWTADLPDGTYRLSARTDDLAGNRGPSVRIDFIVGDTADVEDPDGMLDTPSEGQVFSNGNVTFDGTATDDVSVAEVNLIIRNLDTNQYLQPDGSFGSWNKVAADLTNPNTPATDWDWSGTLPDGTYRLNLQVTDGLGNKDPDKATADFTVGTPVVDLEDPDGMLDTPSEGQVFSNGNVTFDGTATDDVSVAEVNLIIRNLDTNQYLQPDGSFGSWNKVAADLTNPNTPVTDWDWSGTLPDGTYRLNLQVRDGADNQDPVKATADFTVGAVDTVDPDGTLATPFDGQIFTSGNVAFDGTATDNVSVAEVNLVIRDLTTGSFLQPDGSFATSWNKVPASLGAAGEPSTSWTWSGVLPDGAFRVDVQVRDGAGNKDPNKARADFSVAQ